MKNFAFYVVEIIAQIIPKMSNIQCQGVNMN